MTKTRLWRLATLGTAILAVTALLVPAHVGAHTSADYDEVVKRLEQARKQVQDAERRERGLRSEMEATAAKRRVAEIEMEELTAVVDAAQGRLQEAESALALVQSELTTKTEELQRLLRDLQQAHDALADRAVTAYKGRDLAMADAIFGARDFSDLTRRLRMVSRVVAADKARMDLIRTASDSVAEERAQISELRDRAAAQVAAVKSERDRLASLRASVEGRRRSLAGELNQLGGQLTDVKKAKERYLAEQRALEEESNRIRALLRGRTGGTASVGAGEMAWPVSGPVTSGYGWRTHPVYGTSRFHAGIDIGASSGRAVGASAPGQVMFVGERGGYGNTVIVDHGGGLATLYAHLSSISVGSGAWVTTGQRVGAVGCTGLCTGPHLHFEVRVNGEPQNPMRWLS